jgi:hypothetical protein
MKEKIIAALLMAITTLTTVAPVLAAFDLGDYPGFLFTDHNLNAYVVAGADAKPADVVGMTDLAVRLAGESYEEVSAGGLEVAGGKKEEVPMNTALNGASVFGSTLDDTDLSGLKDSSVTITTSSGSEEYDYSEEVRLTSGIVLETGLTASDPDEDYKADAFLEVGTGSVGYYYVLDDDLDVGYYFNDSSSDYPIEIEFLGKTLTITSATATSITAQVGEKKVLKAGDSVTIGGKTITLQSTTSTSKAVVECGGTTKAIAEGAQGVLCGLEIFVDTVLDDDGITNDQAILIIGTDATKTYDDADPYIGQDEDDPDWVWDLSGLTGNNPTIGILFDQNWNEPDEVVKVGSKLCLPENYACIDLNSYTNKEWQKYKVDTTTEDLYQVGGSTIAQSSGYIIHWHATGGGKDGFNVAGEDTDDVGLWFNTTTDDIQVYWKDPDNNKYTDAGTTYYVTNKTAAGTNMFFFTFKDTNMGVYFTWYPVSAPSDAAMTFNTSSGSDINITIELNNDRFEYLGETDGDTDVANDLRYGTRDISGWEEDTMTETGIIIYDPDAHTAGDSFELGIPTDEAEFTANVIATGPTGAITEGGEFIKKVVPITNAVAKLDSEVSLPVNKHLILVGGSAVNKLSAQAMGLTYPTYGSSGLLPFASGEGYIKVFDGTLETGYVAVVVAGWEAQDTRNACSVLQQYGTFKTQLDGNVAVKVTSVTASGITPA